MAVTVAVVLAGRRARIVWRVRNRNRSRGRGRFVRGELARGRRLGLRRTRRSGSRSGSRSRRWCGRCRSGARTARRCRPDVGRRPRREPDRNQCCGPGPCGDPVSDHNGVMHRRGERRQTKRLLVRW